MPYQQFACTRLFHPHLMRSCRTFSLTFTTSSVSTPAAYGGLKPAPTSRLRRTSLHLRYSIVPEHVLDTTPHRSPRAVLPHEAPILDAWRQSERSDKDARCAVSEASARSVAACAPSSGDAFGCDGSTLAATARLAETGTHTGYRGC